MFIDRGDKLDAYPFRVPGSRHPRALTQEEKRKFADEWLKRQKANGRDEAVPEQPKSAG